MNSHPSLPRVSIGMPVFNGGRYLHSAIDSIIGQTFSDFELIISDNASTDSTPEICRAYAANDPRIRFCRQTRNLGGLSNMHFVLQNARAEFFMFAAHDDTREPEFIAKLVALLEKNPDVALAFGRYDNVASDGTIIPRKHVDWKHILSGSRRQQLSRFMMLHEAKTQKANIFYGLYRRRSLAECVESSRGDPHAGMDNLLLLRLLGRAPFAFLDETIFHYRINDTPTKPEVESCCGYIIRRLFSESPGHRGNTLLFLKRTHAYFQEMRRLVLRELPLGGYAYRIGLWIALVFREIGYVMIVLPLSALQELRLIKRPWVG